MIRKGWTLTLATLVAGMGALAGCSGPVSGDELGHVDKECDSATPCPEGFTCRGTLCVENGSVNVGETCTDPIQCADGLVCHELTCRNGCLNLYTLDNCPDAQWCKPVPGETIVTATGTVPLGECSDSECNPSEMDFCQSGLACVAVSGDVGACLPYCEYGFDGGIYRDTCEDTPGKNFTCQPLGLTDVPVCFPAGGIAAPGTGSPGCDTITAPCQSGNICYNVVCRELCTPGQLNPCPDGYVCEAVGVRTDLFFCRPE